MKSFLKIGLVTAAIIVLGAYLTCYHGPNAVEKTVKNPVRTDWDEGRVIRELQKSEWERTPGLDGESEEIKGSKQSHFESTKLNVESKVLNTESKELSMKEKLSPILAQQGLDKGEEKELNSQSGLQMTQNRATKAEKQSTESAGKGIDHETADKGPVEATGFNLRLKTEEDLAKYWKMVEEDNIETMKYFHVSSYYLFCSRHMVGPLTECLQESVAIMIDTLILECPID